MPAHSASVRPVAVVPVKDTENAKQRLSPLLGPDQRQALYRAMLSDVLDALAASRLLAGVLMVTRDPWASAAAAGRGFQVLHEARNEGHTHASTAGARALADRGADAMLQVPGDLPLLRGEDVDTLVAAHGTGRAVTMAPSRDRRGSNAVLCSPPDLLPLRFGEDSFVPHIARALSLQLQPRVVELPGFAFDVDTPEDLLLVMSGQPHRPIGQHTAAYLHHSGITPSAADRSTSHR